MLDRILGVFKLDRTTFAEIEHDSDATTQAAIIVAIVAALSVIGQIIGMLVGAAAARGDTNFGGAIVTIVVTFIMAFVNWVIWAAVTYFVGTQLFHGEATLNEMLRVTGFAYAPRMLSIIPCIGGLIGAIWSLIAGYIGIKEGLDLDDGPTIATVLIGWLITIVINFVLGALGLGSTIGLGILTGGMGG